MENVIQTGYTHNDMTFRANAHLITESNLNDVSNYASSKCENLTLNESLIGLYLVEHLYHNSFSIEQNLNNYDLGNVQHEVKWLGKIKHFGSNQEFEFIHYSSIKMLGKIKEFVELSSFYLDDSEMMQHGERPLLICLNKESIDCEMLCLGQYLIRNVDTKSLDVVKNLNEFEVIA